MRKRQLSKLVFVTGSAALVFTSCIALAEEEKKADGLELGVAVTLEYLSNVSGGISRESAFLGNVDLTAVLDTGAAGWWNGGTFNVYVLADFNGGRVPTEIVGDIQGTSNIEAPETLKLYEAWYSHSFMEDAASLLVGLHDYNSEFCVMEYGGVFSGSSFGIPPQVSQVGPSIFPTTSLAARLRVMPVAGSYVLAGLYDGVPGNPNNEKSSAVMLDSDDGVFSALELGLARGEGVAGRYYKLALGGWYLTSETERLDGGLIDRNSGAYVAGEWQVYQEQDQAQGLGVFCHLGNAAADRNSIVYSIDGGMNYTGLLPGRGSDVLGCGVARAVLSDEYRGLKGNEGLKDAETVIELVYQAAVTRSFTLKPDVQYVIDPSSAPGIRNALVLGLRGELEF